MPFMLALIIPVVFPGYLALSVVSNCPWKTAGCRKANRNTEQGYEESAQRRRKHCTLAIVRRSQNFRPATDPLPAAQDGQN